jgi:hypothetical protein
MNILTHLEEKENLNSTAYTDEYMKNLRIFQKVLLKVSIYGI